MLRTAIAAAAVVGVVMLAPAPRFNRRPAAEPSIPDEAPVTDDELRRIVQSPTSVDPQQDHARKKRRADRRGPKILKRWRARRSARRLERADPESPRGILARLRARRQERSTANLSPPPH